MRAGTRSFEPELRTGKWGQPAERAVRVRVSPWARDAVVTLLVGSLVLAWFGEPHLAPGVGVPRLIRGRSETETFSFAVSADGGSMATTATDGRLAWRDAASAWAIKRSLCLPDHIKTVAFSPAGRLMAFGGV